MPLFKLNLHAAVMPSIEVDGTAELIIPHSDADVAIPLFLVDGTMGADGESMVPMLSVSGRMEGVADGEVSLPMLSVDGFTAIPVQIEGDAFFQTIGVTGLMMADASVDIPCLRVDGDASVGGIIYAEIEAPLLTVDGGVDVAVNADGSVTFSPCLQVDGGVLVAGQFDGNVAFSLLTTEGSVTEIQYSDCSVIFPISVVAAEAEVHTPATISCEASFQSIDVSGSMQTVGDVSFAPCRVDGSMYIFQHASCSVTFPVPLVSGSASRSISSTIAGSVVFQLLQASGVVADQAITGHGHDSVLRYADDRRLI